MALVAKFPVSLFYILTSGVDKMKLSARLEKIVDLVDRGVSLADIGTDHGYIPIELLKSGKIEFAILSDINKGPLEIARKEIQRQGLDTKTDLRLGSGLEVLGDNEADQIIIAGMGGILISDLIEKRLELCKKLDKMILQPMQAQEDLREYLNMRGFSIREEYLVREDFRLYEIMEVVYGGETEDIDPIYYEIPKRLIEKKDPLLVDLLEKKIRENKSILDKLDMSLVDQAENKSLLDRKRVVEDKLNKLNEIYKGLGR